MLIAEAAGHVPVYHDMGGSFGRLLECALRDTPAIVALGPVYQEDPAAKLMLPFMESARGSGWLIETEQDLAPQHVLERAQDLRNLEWSEAKAADIHELVRWTRAGLVLEVASRRGVNMRGLGVLHPRWKLRGTVTGRFGVESVRFGSKTVNMMALPADERWRLVPSAPGRSIASIDFKAMDVSSMTAVVPGMARRYSGAHDLHWRTAELVLQRMVSEQDREVLKKEIFVHAYGGHSPLRADFDRNLPELNFLRRMGQGDAGRLIQTASAKAFRGALSRVLPLLVHDEAMPVITVHDELVIDVERRDLAVLIASEMALGASEVMGVEYRTGLKCGDNYAECKPHVQSAGPA